MLGQNNIFLEIFSKVYNQKYRIIKYSQQNIFKYGIFSIYQTQIYEDLQHALRDENIRITLKSYLNEFVLENKFLALPFHTCLCYLYYELCINLFKQKYLSDLSSKYLIDAWDPDKIFDDDTKNKIIRVHSSYSMNGSEVLFYTILIKDIELSWNDYILSTLAKIEVYGIFSNPTDNTISDIFIVNSATLHYRYSELINIGNSIINNTNIVYSSNARAFEKWKYTNMRAPMLNGTACTGKSSILEKTLRQIQMHYDANATILKTGKMGSYQGKDKNQILSLSYQYMTTFATTTYYTSISDRCIFNNLIWRIILLLMDSNENIVEKAVKLIIENISIQMVSAMTYEPIIILIDLDAVKNREKMKARNKGGDYFRCKIPNYVHAQNLVYGLFAYLGEWVVFNTNANFDFYNKVQELLINKIEYNIKANNNTLPPIFDIYDGKFQNKLLDETTTYISAKKLNIFK
uniref:Uncharacterized protein n=1 Tax=Faxonius propinquus nudivirus TaxID=3139431 RepID=A0AAU8GD11_9VIRU